MKSWKASGLAWGHFSWLPPSPENLLRVSLCQQIWDVGCRVWKEPNTSPLVGPSLCRWSEKDSKKTIGISQKATVSMTPGCFPFPPSLPGLNSCGLLFSLLLFLFFTIRSFSPVPPETLLLSLASAFVLCSIEPRTLFLVSSRAFYLLL